MNQQTQSSSLPSAGLAPNGLKAGLPKTLLCEMCTKIGRTVKADGCFVSEDREEKPVCPNHFLVLQQAELVAEFRKRKLERLESK